ncbi:ABC transporter ATP-binding protein [Candidatus Woesearchaeota archaeon CG07_land_8_20_14_0_80_44_23]|nr:MAG: ABC transporter ATP-binding protein [Candidatus Woesearchaeota archaeon CG07_land_8_20_14_0_80_44_23]
MDYLNDFALLMNAYKKAGGNPNFMKNKNTAFLFVKENKILSMNPVEGLVVDAKQTKNGVDVKMTVLKGVHLKNPIHLCFGIIPKSGIQMIKMRAYLQENSSAEILAHCTFPNAVKVKHLMDGEFHIGKGASLTYNETHFHGTFGGIEVVPKIKVFVGEKASFNTLFSLVIGRVGKLDINYHADCGKDSIVEMNAKVFGKSNDKIKIREEAILSGRNARSVIKTRAGIKDNATSEVYNVTEGNAPYVRGHVDCIEIVSGNAKAKATPIVSVSDETARVTHEAAIGSVDKKQLETLLSHGLSRKEAVDAIIKGMLR